MQQRGMSSTLSYTACHSIQSFYINNSWERKDIHAKFYKPDLMIATPLPAARRELTASWSFNSATYSLLTRKTASFNSATILHISALVTIYGGHIMTCS